MPAHASSHARSHPNARSHFVLTLPLPNDLTLPNARSHFVPVPAPALPRCEAPGHVVVGCSLGVVGERLEGELVVLGHALQLDQLVARAVGGDQRTGVLKVLAHATVASDLVRLAVPAAVADESRE